MNNFCTACGVRLAEGQRICPNCGKLIYQEKQQPAPERKRKRPREAAVKRPLQRERAERPLREETPRPAEASSKVRLIKRLIAAALITAAVYFGFFGLQVLRIRHSSYDFQTNMKMESSNFGEAFDSSVENGHWSYNPFTFRATYSGLHDGKEIKIRFSAFAEVKVEYIEVGGEKKDTDKQKEIYLMGLFI